MTQSTGPGKHLRGPAVGVAIGAIAISFAPVFVEAIDRNDLGPTGVALHRTAIGAVLLALLALARGERLRPSARGGGLAALAGTLFAGDLWVWHRSILRIGGGLATILGNTQVFWVAAAGAAFLGERLSRRFLAAVPLALAGVALLTGVLAGSATSRVDPVGALLGLSTGAFYASYILVVRRAQSREDRLGSVAHMVWVSAACAATCGLLGLVDGDRVWPEKASTWLYLVGLAGVAQVFGWVTLARFLPRVPASRASLLLLLQPTFSTLWVALLFGRSLTLPQAAGAALTLVAIYVGSTAGYPPRPAALGEPGERA